MDRHLAKIDVMRFPGFELRFSIAAAFVVLVTMIHMLALPLIVSYDGMEYVHLADVLSSPAVIAHWNFYRTPLFPLALNRAFWLGGEQPQAALLLTTLLGMAGILLSGFAVRKIAGATSGAITLVLLVFYPVLVGYQHMLLSETGNFFWLALLVWSLIIFAPASKQTAIALACWIALVVALGYYWRPTILYLSPVAALAFLLLALLPAGPRRRYSDLVRQLRRGERRVIAGAVIIALGPWLLASPWSHLTQKHAPGTYNGFLLAGMFKQVLVRPSDPLLAPLRAEYEAAIQQDSVHGRLPLDGVTIGGHQALMEKYIRTLSTVGAGRLIRKYPLRYFVRAVKSMIFFLGVPDHRVDDENWNFSHAVFTLWPPTQSMDRALGWDGKFAQFAPRSYRGGAWTGRLFDGLLPVYTWVVLASSLISLGWMVVSIKQANPIGLTLTLIPFAFLFLHALTLQAADRYAFPVYPLILANLVVVLRWSALALQRKDANHKGRDADESSTQSLLSLAEHGKGP